MYKISVFFLLFSTLSCKKTSVEINAFNSQLSSKLCIVDTYNYDSIVEKETFKNVEGEIFEKKGYNFYVYYIKINNYLYSSCQITESLRKDKTKVVLDGISYQLVINCKNNNPCASLEAFPLFISKITKK